MAHSSLSKGTFVVPSLFGKAALVLFLCLSAFVWWRSSFLAPHTILRTNVSKVESQPLTGGDDYKLRLNVCISTEFGPRGKLCREEYMTSLSAEALYYKGQMVEAEIRRGSRVFLFFPYYYIASLRVVE